jgi:hypothetical protein
VDAQYLIVQGQLNYLLLWWQAPLVVSLEPAMHIAKTGIKKKHAGLEMTIKEILE